MKLQHLFENEDKLKKALSWIIYAAFTAQAAKGGRKNLDAVNDTNMDAYEYYEKNLKNSFWDKDFTQYIEGFTISGDKLSTNAAIEFSLVHTLPEPPFKFGSVVSITFSNSHVVTKLPSWLPDEADTIDLTGANITSLSGIDKIVKKCRAIKITPSKLEGGVLGLMNIEGLKRIEIFNNQRLTNLMNIINAALKDGGDIFDLQDALQDAGLEEYAKL